MWNVDIHNELKEDEVGFLLEVNKLNKNFTVETKLRLISLPPINFETNGFSTAKARASCKSIEQVANNFLSKACLIWNIFEMLRK